MFLRHLVLETASETEGVNKLEETLKWGEPSYLTKNGSTIRMDWKKSKPDLIRKNRQPKYIPLKISSTNCRLKSLKGVLDYESREILLSSIR